MPYAAKEPWPGRASRIPVPSLTAKELQDTWGNKLPAHS